MNSPKDPKDPKDPQEPNPAVLASGELKDELRYGENPHQSEARLYQNPAELGQGIGYAEVLQGKALSYNNLLDANAAWRTVLDFDADTPACVVAKHTQPCGVAIGEQQLTACQRAFASDPESSFGGIVALNSELTADTAEFLRSHFLEVVVAPKISAEAAEILAQKKNLRLLAAPQAGGAIVKQLRSISGGFLTQDYDSYLPQADNLEWVSEKKPSGDEVVTDLLFAWRVAKHCISNAIVLAKQGQVIGIGAGQTSRVFSVRIALLRAKDNSFPTKDAVVASDGFFPFPDSIDDYLAGAGVGAIIQPGGSKKDPAVIEAANKHGIAMAFVGKRSFHHGG